MIMEMLKRVHFCMQDIDNMFIFKMHIYVYILYVNALENNNVNLTNC